MQAWEEFLTLQEKELGKETIQKWLRPLKILRFDACNLYLEANDSFQIVWFEEHIRQKAQAKLFNNNHKKIKVHLSVANISPEKLSGKSQTKSQKAKKTSELNIAPIPTFSLSFHDPDPHCSFENFIVTENNKLPYALLKELSELPDPSSKNKKAKAEMGAFNPIFLHGPPGSGKTHLMAAVTHALKKKGFHVVYAHAETFTEHVVTAIRAGGMSAFRQAYRNMDVLLIDGIEVFSRKGATQEEFFHTFNTLHLAGKQIILSANCAPQDLQLIEPRLISRFEWGISLPLESLNQENLPLLLKNKAEAFQHELAPKVSEFLLETFKSSPKALTRSLEALVLRSHLNKTQTPTSPLMTVPAAKHCLSDLIHEEEQSAITANKVVHTVAGYYGIQSEDILGKAQTRDCVLPRQIAMFLCRNKLNWPFTKIGDLFGKDHSTVMSSVKQIQKHLDQSEKEVAAALSKILQRLHG